MTMIVCMCVRDRNFKAGCYLACLWSCDLKFSIPGASGLLCPPGGLTFQFNRLGSKCGHHKCIWFFSLL